jgi:hypothetical protein
MVVVKNFTFGFSSRAERAVCILQNTRRISTERPAEPHVPPSAPPPSRHPRGSQLLHSFSVYIRNH